MCKRLVDRGAYQFWVRKMISKNFFYNNTVVILWNFASYNWPFEERKVVSFKVKWEVKLGETIRGGSEIQM